MRSLQAAEQAASLRSYKPTPVGDARSKWERGGPEAAGSSSPAGVKNEARLGVAKAKQVFAAKAEGAQGGKTGSQMEEALRKLHGKGVVPAKMAFNVGSKSGTQHSEAMKAFQSQDGTNMSTGFFHKTPVAASKPAAKISDGVRCTASDRGE